MADVLVVEDSTTDAHAYGRMLRAHGHVVHVASTGEEGLALASSLQPDVILMDVVMPGVNGFEATRMLRRERTTANIPVIILSTKAQDTDRIWGLRQGAIDYLIKPVTRPVLLRSVDAALADA
jgi:twitching motility two-component system response regulator PilH